MILIFHENAKWDGDVAKSDLFEWGTCPKDDTVLVRKKLKPYFGKIENKGRNKEDYGYPLAKIVNGKPEYDREGMISAFSFAKSAHTGNVDNLVVNKVVRIFKRVFGSENMTEGMKQNEIMMPDGRIFEDGKEPRIPLEISWDDAKAKNALIKWATDDQGHIQKKLLMKWFLDIDGGNGQNPLDYRYPVGNVRGMEPEYDPIGINHSWDLSAGKKTGVPSRMIQRKIIFLKQREKLPLTNEQLDFISRHMTSGDFLNKQNAVATKIFKNELRSASVFEFNKEDFYVSIDSDIKLNAINEEAAFEIAYEYAKSGKILNDKIRLNIGIVDDVGSPGEIRIIDDMNMTVHYNSVAHYGKILVETPDYIDIPVIPMREGVFIGTDGIPTLKQYDVIAKDAHWLEGQPILEKHTRPDEIVTYKHNRIGKLINVQIRPDTRDVSAVARYYKNKISPEKLEQIKSGNPYDGSIAYTCETILQNGDFDGQKYNAVETTGYQFYHFAEVSEGACSVSRGCGFNLNESFYVDNNTDGNTMKTNACDKKKKDEKAEMVEEEPVEEVLVVDDDGNECAESEMVEGKCPVAEEEVAPVEEFKENSLGEKTVTVDVRIPEEFTLKMNAIFNENESLKGTVATLSESVANLTSRIEGLSVKLNSVEDLEVKTKEQRDFDAFSARLNQAAKPDAAKHYEEFKQNGWTYLDTHADILGSTPIMTKLMGTPASDGVSDLAAEKRKLRETLRRKNIA